MTVAGGHLALEALEEGLVGWTGAGTPVTRASQEISAAIRLSSGGHGRKVTRP